MRTTLRALAIAALAAVMATIPTPTGAQDATPTAATCADVMATPAAGHGGHGQMHEATPAMSHGGHDMHDMELPEFDLAYIDMMLPHHESVIALAEVALPRLDDPRLIHMAANIIASQSAEQERMLELRDEWYPDAEPVSMAQMMELMPSMGGDMAHMDEVMSAEWQVRTFCASENPDLAFIEQTIPHHQMAIDVSEDALERAVHPELKEIAREVIDAQQAEIDQLEEIRAELTGEATPAG